MKFSSVVGHTKLKERLIRNVNSARISHAQLFVGPQGSGALPIALAYIQYLGCTNKQTNDSCGECNSCKKHQKNIHPDVHFVFPVNKNEIHDDKPKSDDFMPEWRTFLANNPYQNLFDWMSFNEISQKVGLIGVEEANEIIKKLSLRAYEADYKIMIIWMPEKMHNSAANKILKILEEPEGKTLFIMVAENADELLPTIISRTQLIVVQKYADEDIENALVNQHEINNTKAKEIAYISNGNLNFALQQIAFEENDFSNLNFYKVWMRNCYVQKIKELMSWVEEIASIGRERQKNFLQYVMQNIRNNFALTIGANTTVKLSEDENEFAQKFHQFIHTKNTNKIFDDLNKAFTDIDRNVNAKMVFLDLSLKICGHLRIPNS